MKLIITAVLVVNGITHSFSLELVQQQSDINGAYDYMPWDSYVINRFDMSFNAGGTSTLRTFNDPFLRFFYTFNFLGRRR